MQHDYIPLTQDQIERAQHSDIIEWLKRKGEPLKKEGKYFIWKEHDSVRIQGYKWIQNSTGEHGAAVYFLEHFYGMYFPDAVLELLGEHPSDYSPVSRANKPIPQADIVKHMPAVFILPKKNDDVRRVYAYLTKTRRIDADIVNYFIDEQKLYEDAHHNAVFVGHDKTGVPRYVFKKGTNTFKSFKVIDGDFNYGFSITGKNDTLFVFEAAIDLLSYICLHKDHQWTQDNYLALGGLYESALVQFLKDYPHIRRLCFCFDNDLESAKNHGQIMAKKLCSKYTEQGYHCTVDTPELKDWNDVLKNKKGVTYDK